MSPTLKKSPVKVHAVELEYNALRGEMVKRIELRQQLISIALTLAGIFLSVGLSTALVTLIYPPIAMFLALGWAQNDLRVRELGIYIRENLEPTFEGIGYETHVQRIRSTTHGLKAWRPLVMSHSGIFIFTQLMAVGIELLKPTALVFSPVKWGLLSIDLVSMIVVLWITVRASR